MEGATHFIEVWVYFKGFSLPVSYKDAQPIELKKAELQITKNETQFTTKPSTTI